MINRDKKVMYALSILICSLLIAALFVPVRYSGILSACLLVPAALLTIFLVRKRQIHSINKYWVTVIVGISVVVYVVVHYVIGLYFGMGHRSTPFTFQIFLTTVFPLILAIIAIEIIRTVFLAQKDGLVSVLAYIMGVATDILMVGGWSEIVGMNDFMDLVGLTILPAVTGNWLYHYLARRYGFLPGAIYRLVLSLYPIVIPYVTFTPDALVAFGRLILPLLLYLFLFLTYEKKKVTHKKPSPWSYVATGGVVLLMLSIVMVISCQFKYGALVIATGSMTGEMNVGDAIVYERYENQTIQVGDVIVFKSGDSRVIHRVAEIKQIDGELRYITKGDANEDVDLGYRTHSDITGMVMFKIAYVGYPSVWINRMFK